MIGTRRQLQVLAIAAVFAVSAPAVAQLPQQEVDETCTIDGYVVRIGSGEPLRKAQVVLRPERGRSPVFGAVTDASGHFTLDGIPPGNYRLDIERDGYVDQEYGQVSPSRPGTVLVLLPGQQVSDVIISMVPTGTIAGRVFDQDGDPLVRATVRALRHVYQDGEKTLTQVDQAVTNDLGEYRLYWLDPGDYIVSATYEARFRGAVELVVRGGGRGRGGRGTGAGGGGGRGRGLLEQPPTEETYVDTYYPGTSDPTLASSIVVGGGAEIPAIDFNVLPTRAVTLRGRVVSPYIGEGGLTPIVTVVSRDNVVAGNRFNFRGSGGRGGRGGQNQDGSFELTGVAPGSYTLVAILTEQGRFGRTGQGQLVGTADIEVGEDDVEGLLITIIPGVAIQGRVLVDQGASDVDPTRLRVRLQPDNNMPFNAPNTPVGDDGTFVLENVSQASYRATVTGLPRDAYLAAVRYGGTDVLSGGLQVMGDPPGPLEFLVSGAGGVVDGSIQIEQDKVFTGAQVVLVPAAARDRRDLYKTASVDQYGRFTIRGIAPGGLQGVRLGGRSIGRISRPGLRARVRGDGDVGRRRPGR